VRPATTASRSRRNPAFRLVSRQYVDFTDGDAGLARLRLFLADVTKPTGALRELRYRLADAERELPRAADEPQRRRIQEDVSELRERIFAQELLLRDPDAAAARTEQRIATNVEMERRLSFSEVGCTSARVAGRVCRQVLTLDVRSHLQ